MILTCIVSGCGESTGSLSGHVRFDGKAVTSGSVMIVAADGLPHYGRIQDDGTYEIAGIPTGPSMLTVTSPHPSAVALDADAKDTRAAKKRGTAKPAGTELLQSPDGKWLAIPERYSDPENSGLSVTVGRGQHRFDIELRK